VAEQVLATKRPAESPPEEGVIGEECVLFILAVILGDFRVVHGHVVLFLAEHIMPGNLALVLLPVGRPPNADGHFCTPK
jgi:hypothetical protein